MLFDVDGHGVGDTVTLSMFGDDLLASTLR